MYELDPLKDDDMSFSVAAAAAAFIVATALGLVCGFVVGVSLAWWS